MVPFLKINNKIYKEFKKEKKNLLINDSDEEDEKEIKNLVNIMELNQKDDKNKIIENKNIIKEKKDDENDNLEYKLLIKLNDLIKGENQFNLFIYYYSFYR